MNLEGSDAWSDLGDGILVRQSKAFAMNSVVLASAEHTILVDPGVLPSEMDDIAGLVREAEPRALTLFFTHGHWDHVLGRPWWPKAKTLAHDRLAAELSAERDGILKDIEALAIEHGERWSQGFEPFTPDQAVSGLKFLKLDPWGLVLRDAPGHCASQLSCHLPEQNVLIAADMLSDIEPPGLEGPGHVYRGTLDALLLLAKNGAIDTVIPGHGSVAQGRDAVLSRFRADLDYLSALERAVATEVAKGLTLEATQATLAAMDYPGKGSTLVDSFHKENIRHIYQNAPHRRR